MKKPILYLDFDGVMMAGPHFQTRPRILEFLQWAVERFECRWFSHEDKQRIDAWLYGQFRERLGEQIRYVECGGQKPAFIDYSEDWYWLDDSDSWNWNGRGGEASGRLIVVDYESDMSLQDLGIQKVLEKVLERGA